MKKEIMLKCNKGYEWHRLGGVSVKGYAFDISDQLLEGREFARFFEGVDDLASFKDKIQQLNGVFSIVLDLSHATYLGVDINRTFPLFYIKQDEVWFVSDDANFLQEKFNLKFNSAAKKEFIHAGYVTGKYTLLENLHQVQAAEVLGLNEGDPVEMEYWTYASGSLTNKGFKELQKELLAIYENLAKRLIEVAEGKTIVIPLSGGYDSRLVLALLIKQGYKNIHCFTYGVKTSFEMKIAKKVAAKLNVKLEVVEYDNAFIDRHFDKNEFFEYIKFASNFVSLSHIQDFLAVRYLHNEKIIPIDSIIAPGHSGDIFSGTHISNNIDVNSPHQLARSEIKKKHYSLNLGSSANINYYDESCFPYSNMEAWSWKERQAKFIVNSLRIYDYFDYKSVLPLWDKELADFFRIVSLRFKNREFLGQYEINNNLYDSVSFRVFNDLGVGIVKKDRFILIKKVLFRIKGFVGEQGDPINNFDYLIQKIEAELGYCGNGCVNSRLSKLIYLIVSER